MKRRELSNPVLVPTGRERRTLSTVVVARGTTQRERHMLKAVGRFCLDRPSARSLKSTS